MIENGSSTPTAPRTARRKKSITTEKTKKLNSEKGSQSEKKKILKSKKQELSDSDSSPIHQSNPKKSNITKKNTPKSETPKKVPDSSVKTTPTPSKKRKNSLKDSKKKKKKEKNCDSDLERNDYDSDLEFEEDDEFLRPKVACLGDLFKEHKGKICLFTGAGISSSAGLKTYRGKDGIWLKQDNNSNDSKDNNLKYFPTLTHMAIKQLYDLGYIKYIITQNSDNLHWKSGIKENDMIEIHGNSYKEHCEKCDKTFIRQDIIVHPTSESIFRNVMNKNENFKDDHITINKCENCGGTLKDVIVNFGEKLSEELWKKAVRFIENSTLVLAIGTKLSVEPVNSLVTMSNNLIICNLQLTPFNDNANLVIRCKSDELFSRLMGKVVDNIIIDIPEYVYQIDLNIQYNNNILELKSEELNVLEHVILNENITLNSKNHFSTKNDQLDGVELNSMSIRLDSKKFASSCSISSSINTIDIKNCSKKIEEMTQITISIKFHTQDKRWEYSLSAIN